MLDPHGFGARVPHRLPCRCEASPSARCFCLRACITIIALAPIVRLHRAAGGGEVPGANGHEWPWRRHGLLPWEDCVPPPAARPDQGLSKQQTDCRIGRCLERRSDLRTDQAGRRLRPATDAKRASMQTICDSGCAAALPAFLMQTLLLLHDQLHPFLDPAQRLGHAEDNENPNGFSSEPECLSASIGPDRREG